MGYVNKWKYNIFIKNDNLLLYYNIIKIKTFIIILIKLTLNTIQYI